MIHANLPRTERTFTGDNRPGRRMWVYGREGAPCRRCGTPIRATTLGASATSERNVYWCPTCQPE
jgi:endonuclease-8